MKTCPETPRVQAYLDGDLSPSDSDAFQTHLSSCVTCALEVSLYRRVIDSIARAATWDPATGLTERVLDEVLPARVRRRWARRFATGYAAALVATVGGLGAILAQPAARDSAIVLTTAATRGMVQSLALVLHALGVVVTGLAGGWGLLESLGQRLAPFVRVIATLVRDTGIALPCVVAALACAAVLAWMRARDARGAPRIGLLGF